MVWGESPGHVRTRSPGPRNCNHDASHDVVIASNDSPRLFGVGSLRDLRSPLGQNRQRVGVDDSPSVGNEKAFVGRMA